jgi:exosome complex RNA-binding protein Csl4
MMKITRVPAFALALTVSACAGGGLGGLGDILGGGGQPQSGTLTAEIQEVQTSRQQIVVATQDGQQGAVLFDQNTQVVYQNQEYPVTALEYGDIVDMRVQEVQQGLYTDLIQVRQSVQERRGETSSPGSAQTGVYQVEGTIGSIDTSEGMFTLDMTQGGSLPVYLPANASASIRARLDDYRTGDYVRVEVRAIDEQTAELIQWGWSS